MLSAWPPGASWPLSRPAIEGFPILDLEQRHAAIRTALIGFGIAAYSYLVARPGTGGSVLTLIIGGVGLQALLIATRTLIKRTVADRNTAAQMLVIAELVGDGITVLLFALGTLGAIVHAPDQL